MIDVNDEELDVDNWFGLGKSDSDAEIRARKSLKQSYKTDTLAAKQQNKLAAIKGGSSESSTSATKESTDTTTNTPPPAQDLKDEGEKDNTMMYLGIGGIAIVVIGVIIYFVMRNK